MLRKQEEAKDYEAKYHFAEAKRFVAVSHMHELTLVLNGDEQLTQKAGKQDSKEELRKKLRLAQKENEVRLVVNCM